MGRCPGGRSSPQGARGGWEAAPWVPVSLLVLGLVDSVLLGGGPDTGLWSVLCMPVATGLARHQQLMEWTGDREKLASPRTQLCFLRGT